MTRQRPTTPRVDTVAWITTLKKGEPLELTPPPDDQLHPDPSTMDHSHVYRSPPRSERDVTIVRCEARVGGALYVDCYLAMNLKEEAREEHTRRRIYQSVSLMVAEIAWIDSGGAWEPILTMDHDEPTILGKIPHHRLGAFCEERFLETLAPVIEAAR
jgi:hypothetical protein